MEKPWEDLKEEIKEYYRDIAKEILSKIPSYKVSWREHPFMEGYGGNYIEKCFADEVKNSVEWSAKIIFTKTNNK